MYFAYRNEIEEAVKLGKYVVVAGCVPQGAPKSSFLKGLSVIGVQQIDRVVEVVEETLKGIFSYLCLEKTEYPSYTGFSFSFFSICREFSQIIGSKKASWEKSWWRSFRFTKNKKESTNRNHTYKHWMFKPVYVL